MGGVEAWRTPVCAVAHLDSSLRWDDGERRWDYGNRKSEQRGGAR